MTTFPFMPMVDVTFPWPDLFESTSSLWDHNDRVRRARMDYAETEEEVYFYRGTLHEGEH